MDQNDLKSLAEESPLNLAEKQELFLLLEQKGASDFLSRFEEMYVGHLQTLEQHRKKINQEIDRVINSVEDEYTGEREKLNSENEKEKIALLRDQKTKKAQSLVDDILNKLKNQT
ncbi:hypothetical protein A3B93_00170 [Candidatus Nomurabacteria bacterium RIFCSPHIGHO2_02_FULL_42_24]|uniref:Uncharacterized protein n=1 Tax=Candidatus Nomurabacteria bacterium RIFCSPHIGHO2_02_FULL_42_24 TaxID=1801757 RepID=A0A1F6WHL2_9BACT|nr:MAG: hypothetical protein A3B93_00170 [Candidatus Nomurabacteria bacterium RIFCSPHIGHO2_02_FULL_42_24]